jgi:hypothetical protein
VTALRLHLQKSTKRMAFNERFHYLNKGFYYLFGKKIAREYYLLYNRTYFYNRLIYNRIFSFTTKIRNYIYFGFTA